MKQQAAVISRKRLVDAKKRLALVERRIAPYVQPAMTCELSTIGKWRRIGDEVATGDSALLDSVGSHSPVADASQDLT